MMAEECTHDCSSCGSACASRQKPQSLLAPANAGSRVKKVIGVVSGKGGVGKSLVTGLLACETARRGKIAGVLDADITGPSMPRILGIRDKAVGNEQGILPQEAENGVKVMSINLLLEHDTDPVIWRGSLIAGTVKQFWTDVCWGDVDCLYVDMPPGTGDVPLTVFQSIPLDGVVVVSTPQDLVGMIVRKAVNMANMMNIPVLGLVENMSYALCPDCGRRIELFGKSKIAQEAAALHLPVLAQLPFDPKAAQLCDEGSIETVENPLMADAARAVAGQVGL